jgi:hypothetical protein
MKLGILRFRAFREFGGPVCQEKGKSGSLTLPDVFLEVDGQLTGPWAVAENGENDSHLG